MVASSSVGSSPVFTAGSPGFESNNSTASPPNSMLQRNSNNNMTSSASSPKEDTVNQKMPDIRFAMPELGMTVTVREVQETPLFGSFSNGGLQQNGGSSSSRRKLRYDDEEDSNFLQRIAKFVPNHICGKNNDDRGAAARRRLSSFGSDEADEGSPISSPVSSEDSQNASTGKDDHGKKKIYSVSFVCSHYAARTGVIERLSLQAEVY